MSVSKLIKTRGNLMYRINQVAGMLDISTVLIHEKLITERDQLAPHLHKENSITYIDSDGVKILSRMVEEERLKSVVDDKLVESQDESNSVNKLTPEDEEILLLRLKEKISYAKTDIKKLDIEIARKDQAIEHYQSEIENDSQWLHQLEEKFDQYLRDILTITIKDENVEKKGLVDILEHLHKE